MSDDSREVYKIDRRVNSHTFLISQPDDSQFVHGDVCYIQVGDEVISGEVVDYTREKVVVEISQEPT